jgi:hypothetical protein
VVSPAALFVLDHPEIGKLSIVRVPVKPTEDH